MIDDVENCKTSKAYESTYKSTYNEVNKKS